MKGNNGIYKAVLEAISDYGGHPAEWQYYFEYLFEPVSLTGKAVLDVGGGIGRASFYAAGAGAFRVVCLEPEVEGSRNDMVRRAEKLRARLGLQHVVEIKSTPLERAEFNQQFDVVLLHNSINHFNEDACAKLHFDAAARAHYAPFLSRLQSVTRPGGVLLLADCSRRNFFADVGLKNPFAPTINWRIHQPPAIWIRLLSEFGFVSPHVRWTFDRRLRHFGRVFLGNRVAAYFLQSHFCLDMRRSIASGD